MPIASESRTAASGRNLRAALFGQVLTVTVNLLARRIFIRLLGSEYAGFSGLCGHLLNFLSILEPGFDMACSFMLYRPLAYGDKILVSQICRYIERVYRKIALATFALGLLLFPLALHISKGSIDRKSLSVIWLMTVAEMSTAYLFSHRRILPVADQKGYVITTYGYVFFILSQFLRLFVLVKTENYIAYLAAGITVGILEEILLYRKIGKMYPFLPYAPYTLPEKERKGIIDGTRALFFHKAGGILCGSVDNMAVFLFLGLHGGAMYSNYTMLLGTCLSFIGVLCGAIAASIGNLGVTESRTRMMKVYSAAFFTVFFAATLLSLSLFFTYPLIIKAWMGEEMVLGGAETALFSFSMFISALRRPTGIFLDSYGLFDKEKYKAITEAAIGCAATFLLAPKYGIAGVLCGQIIGALSFSLWFEPYILYKYGFCEDFRLFLRTLLCYIPAFLLSAILCAVLCNVFSGVQKGLPYEILTRIILCLFSTSSVFGIMFFDKTAMKDSARYAVQLLAR